MSLIFLLTFKRYKSGLMSLKKKMKEAMSSTSLLTFKNST